MSETHLSSGSEPVDDTSFRGEIVDDSQGGRSLLSPVCTFCKHLDDDDQCPAFPQGIPLDIWEGHNNHQQPYPGDHGIRFEAASL